MFLAALRMLDPDDDTQSLARFSGQVPLFPLPNPAFFPHGLLPLHVFEPRYRQMTARVLDGDRLIAVAQLSSGWELRREPLPIESHVCLGRIQACEAFPDGRYALILQGVARAKVLSEATDEPYRIAQVELAPDQDVSISCAELDRRRRELLDAFCDLYPRSNLEPLLHDTAETAIPLGILCDLAASALPLSPAQSQELLAETDVDRRYKLVLEYLRGLRRKSPARSRPQEFRPGFSSN